jgi:glycosyltransferase involved in cell wall biosynthesis
MSKLVRVLQVTGIMNRGGAEAMIMNLYRNIDKSRVQFDFVENSLDRGLFDDEIGELGGKIYYCPHHVGKNHFEYKRWWKKFFKEHKGEYDIVHGHIGSTAAIYLKIAKKNGVYTIAHSHSSSFGGGIKGLMYQIMSYPTRNIADYFLACSYESGVSRYGNKIGNNLQKCTVVNNAIDSSKFSFNLEVREKYRKEFNLVNRFVIGHIGRYLPEKNHTFLIDVFSEIYNKNKNAELVLIGDGPLRKEIEDKIHQLKLENVVKILGVRSDIAQLTQMLDVLAFPSLYEGLPVTLIECQAAGLPCICSDVITKNVDITGLCDFVPLNDLQKWCKAILSCVGTKRENTTEKIMQAGYDITTTARWIEEFYSEKSKR